METIDLTADIETTTPEPKAKAKSRAKAKAEPAEVKPKAKPRAKAKSKAAATPVEVEDEPMPAIIPQEGEITEVEPVAPPEVVVPEPEVVVPEPEVVQPELVEAETTTRKPKGHRPKIENKEKLTKKVSCKTCDKTVSLHSIKYTHKKTCKPEEPEVPLPLELTRQSASSSSQPTLREKLHEKRLTTAQRLISQCFF